MKKIICFTIALALIGGVVFAQGTKRAATKNQLSLSAGPSFPIGAFGSTDVSSSGSEAGMAKTGFTIDLNYVHQFDKVFGLGANVVYGNNGLDDAFTNSVPAGVEIDNWQYYAVLVGPSLTTNVTPKTSFNFGVFTGASFVRSPGVSQNGNDLLKSDWSTVLPLKASADFRFRAGKNVFILAGADYLYMKPSFSTTLVEQGEVNITQKINVLGVKAGVGLNF